MGQGTTFASFLLQARPDRNSVLGLYVDKLGLVFMITNAEGVQRTDMASWKDPDSAKLLYAFITRLYTPHERMIDPTVERVQGEPRVFDIIITLEDGSRVRCIHYPSLYISRCVWTTHNNFYRKGFPSQNLWPTHSCYQGAIP